MFSKGRSRLNKSFGQGTMCAYLFAFISVFFFFTCSQKSWAVDQTGGIVYGTEDVPLMKGFTLVEEPLIFDNPEGRIIVNAFVTSASPSEIQSFYDLTLPSLGWNKIQTTHRTYVESYREIKTVKPRKSKEKNIQKIEHTSTDSQFDLAFVRDQERLSIHSENINDGTTRVVFKLQPSINLG